MIRAKSVHSNRHAPSRDIANAFAHGNRIRHSLSGARVLVRTMQPSKISGPHNLPSLQTVQTPSNVQLRLPSDPIDAGEAGLWQQVGAGPLGLLSRPNTMTHYLGLDDEDYSRHGTF